MPATYSFSGADAEVYIWFDDKPAGVRRLEDITTISASVHEAKGQARALGFRGIKGISRGIRTIAGSLILTVVEENPLRPILDAAAEIYGLGSPPLGWSIDQNEMGIGTALQNFNFANKIAPLIPPFNILIQYVSEAAGFYDVRNGEYYTKVGPTGRETLTTNWTIPGAAVLLRGVEFVDDGIVTSVHDIVSEVTLSFLARDLKPIARMNFETDDISNTLFGELCKHEQGEAALRTKLYAGRDASRSQEVVLALTSLGYKVGAK